MRILSFILLVCILSGFIDRAEAKENDFKTPGFLKKEPFLISDSESRRSGLSAADAKQFTARVMELRDLLEKNPVAGKPVGYNTLLSSDFEDFNVPYRPDLKPVNFPPMALIWFGAFDQEFDSKGQLEHTLGETTLLAFWINRLPEWNEMPWEWEKQPTDAVLMPEKFSEPLAGLMRYGDLLILKRNNRPLWTPVSMNEAMNLVISQRKSKLSEIEKKADEAHKNYTDYISPAKREERKNNYKMAAKYQKDPVAFLAQMEDIEHESEEIFRKQAEEATPESWTWWADAIRLVREAEEDYASLSPAEKTANACYIKPAYPGDPKTRLRNMLVPAGRPGCREVIRPNWKYFDAGLPRSAVQLITIWVRDCPEKRPPSDGNPGGCTANMKLLRSLNWELFKAIMDR